ncbi:MAG: DEAD/DEAH box helicase [Bacteroidota bacterium]
MIAFDDLKLPKALLAALEEQQINTPTAIQHKAIPSILSGRDVIGIAQTGTGKTLTYLLPLIRELKYSEQRAPRALILVPTRELATQVASEIERLTSRMFTRVLAVYGGTNMNTQKKAVHEGCDILVGTPGRVYDLGMTRILRFNSIKKLVIDECDEMLNLGFRPQIERILEQLPSKRQNLLFSATITEDVKILAQKYFAHPEMIEAAPTGTPLEQIRQVAYAATNFLTKYNYLHYFFEQHRDARVFVFTRSKRYADLVFEKLNQDFPERFGVIHSNKSQNYRLRMVADFKSENLQGLVATDLVARGIDIEDVTHVINFDIPEEPEGYMHRIGRTGRKNKEGTTISLVQDDQRDLFSSIEQYMRQTVPVEDLPASVEQTTQLIPDEEAPSIHDAPTVNPEQHIIGEGEKNAAPKNEKKKVNYRPHEKVKRKKFKRKTKRNKS